LEELQDQIDQYNQSQHELLNSNQNDGLFFGN
jgi:hypothetical protein